MALEEGSEEGFGHDERLRILSGALRSFAEATTDYEQLLDVVARTLADVVKDGCVVRLLAGEGWLSPVAIRLPFEAHVGEAGAIARVREHVARAHNLSEHAAGRRVIETGEPLLVPELDLANLRRTATPEIVDAYETIGIHSLLLVPLRVRGESIGLLALVRFAPGSLPFGESDRDLAQALADHAALAISNARLLQTAVRELADRQRAEAALRRTEEQLRHAQKMEAVGRLAAGVAHDFNNILSVILGYADIVCGELRSGEPLRAEMEEVRTAGLRASDLTKQLLAFSRQQVVEPKLLDLGQCAVGLETMLRRLLGADVELTLLLANGLWTVRADQGHIEQILVNLAVNARDAMPSGGKLTIQTANVELDEEYAHVHLEMDPGKYVMMAVTDTGVGMDRETQARVFEPFFTTKERGKGTGLGLSTVYGIVKQAGGHLWLYSEPGAGATFKVYLPRVHETSEVFVPERPTPRSYRGTETILLVEDDDQLRALARRVLRENGYVVLDASNAGEALLVSEQHGAKIHLLLTDVVLPKMGGRKLAERVQAERPDIKVLFMSGYTDDAILQHGVLDSGVPYLQKPLTPGLLTRKVREVLNGT